MYPSVLKPAFALRFFSPRSSGSANNPQHNTRQRCGG